MNRKHSRRLVIASLLFTTPLLILFGIYQYNQRQLSYKFNRNLKPVIKGMKVFDLKYNSFYIAGNTDTSIYLANPTVPRRLVKINSLLTDTQHLTLKIKNTDFKDGNYYRTAIDHRILYLFNGVKRLIYKGDINEMKLASDTAFIPYFQLSIPINDTTIIYRYISSKTDNNSLLKVSGRHNTENNKIFEKQVDGKFCTDGILEFNKYLNKLVYVYYYRNEILLIDTNLQLIKKIKTIDPIDTARFTIDRIESEQSSTFSSPKLLVNGNSSLWKNMIFVESKIMGLNEDQVSFKTSNVIDVYDLEKGKYLYSFYIPSFMKHKSRQFKLFGNYLITLTDQYIIKYKIHLPK